MINNVPNVIFFPRKNCFKEFKYFYNFSYKKYQKEVIERSDTELK